LDRALNNICRGLLADGRGRQSSLVMTWLSHVESLRALAKTDTCREDEEEGRKQLNEQWAQFSKAGRSNCIQTTAIGGRPGYVELSACPNLERRPTLPDAR